MPETRTANYRQTVAGEDKYRAGIDFMDISDGPTAHRDLSKHAWWAIDHWARTVLRCFISLRDHCSPGALKATSSLPPASAKKHFVWTELAAGRMRGLLPWRGQSGPTHDALPGHASPRLPLAWPLPTRAPRGSWVCCHDVRAKMNTQLMWRGEELNWTLQSVQVFSFSFSGPCEFVSICKQTS